MSRAEARELAAGLRPRSREPGVRVHDAADRFEAAVEDCVGRRVRRRALRSRHDVAGLELDDRDQLRSQLLVRDAARLDREHVLAPVDAAYVAESENDEPRSDELAVSLEDTLLQVGMVGHPRYEPWAR